MELFHVINRGVEKRDIVLNDIDRVRFVHDLFVFNNTTDVDPNHRFKTDWTLRKQASLVHIHAWCLMPNHYHLLLSLIDGDLEKLSLFMKKLNMGYAKYFNEKYERSGALWQGKYKKIAIERDAHFLHIPYYIHLNPLDLHMPEWREGSVRKTKEALDFLETYRWSSHLDYLGKKNFPSVIESEFLADILGTKGSYLKEIKNTITNADIASESTVIE